VLCIRLQTLPSDLNTTTPALSTLPLVLSFLTTRKAIDKKPSFAICLDVDSAPVWL